MTASLFSEFDSLVVQLIEKTGMDKARAEATIRANRPDLAPALKVTAERDERILEKEEQAEITKRLGAFGFKVRNLSQARASKQAPGLPDLFVVHRRLPVAFWWESKRQVGGELSPAQVEFRDDCLRCGVGWGSGDRHAVGEYLVHIGLLERVAGQLEPTPLLRQSG